MKIRDIAADKQELFEELSDSETSITRGGSLVGEVYRGTGGALIEIFNYELRTIKYEYPPRR